MNSPNLLLFTLLWLTACGDTAEQTRNHQKIREELSNYTIKRVTEDQIVSQSMELGKALTSTLSKVAVDSTFWLSENGRNYLDSLNDGFPDQRIRFLSLNNGPSAIELDPMEIQLLEAYQYSAENQLPMDANVQLLDHEQVLFTDPLIAEGRLQGVWSIRQSQKAIVRSLD